MHASNRSWIALLIMALILTGLAGCNFPGRATEAPPAAEYTQAAQTVVAELTEVVAQPTTIVTVPPTSLAPSPMPSPTAMPVPTATVAPTPTEKLTLVFSDDFSQQVNWYTEQGQDFGFQFAESTSIYLSPISGAFGINPIRMLFLKLTALAWPDQKMVITACSAARSTEKIIIRWLLAATDFMASAK